MLHPAGCEETVTSIRLYVCVVCEHDVKILNVTPPKKKEKKEKRN